MEEWRQYPTNNKYLISNLGKIKARKIDGTPNMNLEIRTIREGRFTIIPDLRVIKKGTTFGVKLHEIVAELFVENNISNAYCKVRHINKDTRNNRASNLEWYIPQHSKKNVQDTTVTTTENTTTDWQEKLDKIPFPDEQESVYNPVVKRINKYVIMNVPFTSQYMVLFIENKLSEHIGTYESYEEANESIQ